MAFGKEPTVLTLTGIDLVQSDVVDGQIRQKLQFV
jgi:hypothetical protein